MLPLLLTISIAFPGHHIFTQRIYSGNAGCCTIHRVVWTGRHTVVKVWSIYQALKDVSSQCQRISFWRNISHILHSSAKKFCPRILLPVPGLLVRYLNERFNPFCLARQCPTCSTPPRACKYLSPCVLVHSLRNDLQ